MRHLPFMLVVCWLEMVCSVLAQPSPAPAQKLTVEYQYQMHYPQPWRGFPRPGLSLGGSLPEQGRDGISSLYGLPFPSPLGAGVYNNPPPFMGHAVGMPGVLPFGPPVWFGPGPWGANPRNAPALRASVGRSLIPSGPVTPHSISPVAETVESRLTESFSASDQGSQRSAPSDPVAIRLSREQQDAGDAQMRAGHWSQACLNYRNAVDAAEDRAEAHLRLGFAQAALFRFPFAVREFKVALALDPTVASATERLASVFGPNNETVRKSIQRQISEWVREDLHNADRLFLLGLWLHCDDDLRAPEVLEAALRFTDHDRHIVALLVPAPSAASLATQPRGTQNGFTSSNSNVLTQTPPSVSVPTRTPESLGPSPVSNNLPLPPLPSRDDGPAPRFDHDEEEHRLPPLPTE